MLFAVENKTVVYLVRKKHKVMSAGDIRDAFEHFLRIKNAGRVVRVDNNDTFCFRRYFALHIFEIGEPVALLVAHIMHGSASRKTDGSRPKRVIGRGNKNFVAVIEHCLKRKRYHFAAAIARVYIVDVYIGNFFKLTILHYRFSCRKNAL